VNDYLDKKDSIELLLLNHQQIHENIKFADQKAGAVIAADTAVLALTYSQIEPAKLSHLFILGVLVCLILSIAIGLAFFVVRPRGEKNREIGAGFVDSIRISLYSHDQFQAKLSQLDLGDLLGEVQTLVYDRAHIDQRKYFYLRVSLIVSLVGWTVALLLAFWLKLYPTMGSTMPH